MSLASLLFPAEPRTFPGRRALKIVARGVHIVCVAGLFGAYVFEGTRGPWLAATIVSGFAMLALDLHESGAFLLQVKGLVVAVKVVLFCLLPWFAPHEAWLLGFLIVGSAVSSHAPGNVRHRLLFGRGRVAGARSHG